MKFELTILGSSSALPTSKRNLTAHVLNVYERFFLIDCGEGTQIQLRKNRIRFGKINHIFISHLHGDHFYGIFGLLSSYNLLGRTSDLHIYAHISLKKAISYMRRNFESSFSYKVFFHPINPDDKELLFEDKRISVYSFPLKHKIPASGFLFVEKMREPNIKKEYVKKYQIPIKNIHKIKEGADYQTSKGEIIPNKELTIPPYKPRKYAFCTDTGYNEDIIPVVHESDILYHEATFKNQHEDQADTTYHSTAQQAGLIARKANVRKLVIGHFSARYKETDSFITEAQKEFKNTYAAEDGAVFNIKPERLKRN